MSWLLAGVVALLGIAQIVPKIASILKGAIRPSRIGAGIFAVQAVVTAAFYLAAGGGAASAQPVVVVVTGLTVFVLSLRSGTTGVGPVDVASGGIAGVAFAALFAGDPVLALIVGSPPRSPVPTGSRLKPGVRGRLS